MKQEAGEITRTCHQDKKRLGPATIMADINTIKRLNNAAATSLADGDIDAAFSVLHVALEDLRLDLARGNGTHNVNLQGVRPSLDPFTVPVHSSLCCSDIYVSPNNAFHVFTKAFILPESEADFDAVAVVLMYNFGLVLQQKGILSGEERALGKARKIYLMATNLMEMMQEYERMPSQLFALALWNNMGHSHSHFLNLESVRECEGQIRHHLSRGNELSREDLVFFHQAMLFLENCNIASRAAAA